MRSSLHVSRIGGRPRVARRLLLFAVAPAVVLLLPELVARIWLGTQGEEFGTPFWVLDPVLGARIRPDYRGLDDHGFEVEINSLGLRNPEIEVPKPQGRLRILALGDSVTYGFGVTADEAFPRVLEGELERRGLCDVEVVNAGVPGYSSYQGAAFWKLRPTVSLADRRRYCEHVAVLAAQHGFGLVFVNFYDHPYMCEPLRRAHEQLEAGEPQAALESLVEYFRTPPIKDTSARKLMSFDDIANAHLSRVYDALGRPPDDRPYYFPRPKTSRLILGLDIECNGVSDDVAARNGADVVDFRDLTFEDYLDHIHLSPQGHRAVAERLAEILVEREPTAR